MKRSKLFPFLTLLAGVALALYSNAGIQETTWVYAENGERVATPECEFSQAICANEFYLNPDGSLGAPTGNQMHGDKAAE